MVAFHIVFSGWLHRIHECVLHFRIREFARQIPLFFLELTLTTVWAAYIQNVLWYIYSASLRCFVDSGKFYLERWVGMKSLTPCVVLYFWLQSSGTIWYYLLSFGEVVDFLYSLFFEVVVPNGIIIFVMYAYPVLPRNQGVYTSRQDHWPKRPHWKWWYSIAMLVDQR